MPSRLYTKNGRVVDGCAVSLVICGRFSKLLQDLHVVRLFENRYDGCLHHGAPVSGSHEDSCIGLWRVLFSLSLNAFVSFRSDCHEHRT